jgi:hypothetical protein
MKKPFEVGERVLAEWDGTTEIRKIKGTYLGVDGRGFAMVKCSDNTYLCVPRSLRRFVSRVRRRVWISEDQLAYLKVKESIMASVTLEKFVQNDVEFIEVRKPKGKV